MGNCISSTKTGLSGCCKCRTYTVDDPDNQPGHGLALLTPENGEEMNERQPVASGSDEPVDNQPPTENPPENLPDAEDNPGMLRLPRPPRNPIGEFISVRFLSVFFLPGI